VSPDTQETHAPAGVAAFAPLRHRAELRRIAGGSETDVYHAPSQSYVVKIKRDTGGSAAAALGRAVVLRAVADEFTEHLGPRYTIPSEYVISGGGGEAQVLVIQLYLADARPLSHVSYAELSRAERRDLALQLRDLIRRAIRCLYLTGHLPDLHGSYSASVAERERLSSLVLIPWRVWRFLTAEHLLRSHNVLLTEEPGRRLVLVDYDLVRWRSLPRRLYHAARWLLFWRDHWLIQRVLR
jgi:hypothetical protein